MPDPPRETRAEKPGTRVTYQELDLLAYAGDEPVVKAEDLRRRLLVAPRPLEQFHVRVRRRRRLLVVVPRRHPAPKFSSGSGETDYTAALVGGGSLGFGGNLGAGPGENAGNWRDLREFLSDPFFKREFEK
jgi:hypothetical protein